MIDGLKPYPEYKDSRLPWLGRIPSHWELERAKGLFLKMDRPPRTGDQVVTCFRDGTVTLRKNRRLRGFTESLKEIGYQGVRRGELVIHAMDAFAGAVGVSDSDGKCTPVYAVCKPRRELNPHYYSYVVREMARTQWIASLAKGIRERSTDFRFDGFASQPVPFPPVAEQTAITIFFNHANRRIERYIRAKKKLIALLNEQKQAIIHRAVTRGLDPNVRLKPSGIPWLGDIPEHWNLVRAKQISQVFIPQRDKPEVNETEGFPWVTPVNVGEIFTDKINLFVTESALVSAGCRVLPAGSVVASCVGRFGIASVTEVPVIINQQLQAFIPSKAVSAKYLRHCVQVARPYFEAKGNSTTLAYVDRQGFGSMPLPLPSPKEQEAIERFLEAELLGNDQIILRAQREIALIREYRTRLMADVVTGQLDVRKAAAKLPEEPPEKDIVEFAEEVNGEEGQPREFEEVADSGTIGRE